MLDKIKNYIKEANGLAIFSFLIAFSALVYVFADRTYPYFGDEAINFIGICAIFMGIISLIWMKIKKEKGIPFAVLGIIFGLIDFGMVSV